MAYPLILGLLKTNAVPMPVAPSIRRAVDGRLVRLGLLLSLGMAVAPGIFAFVPPAVVFAEEFDIRHLIVLITVAFGFLGGLISMSTIGSTLSVVFGYCIVFRRYGNSHRGLCPEEARPVRSVFALSGLTIGFAVATVGRVLDTDLGYAAAAAALTILAGTGAARVWPKAAAAWREMRAERARQATILASGDHVVGRLRKVRFLREWVDSKPMFAAELTFEYRGRTYRIDIEIVDYPVWAPLEGNEFDMWIDPAGPVDKRHILLRRRYVGQRFGADPTKYREPGEADSGPGAISPPWMSNNPDKVDKMTHPASPVVRFVLALPPVFVAAVTVVTAILAPQQVDDVSTASQLLLWLYAALNLYNAALYLLYQARSRWMARTGVKLTIPTMAAAFSMCAGIGAMVLSPKLFHLLETGDEPWTAAHVLIMVSMVGSLLVFAWAFVSMDRTVRHFNGETPAPAEVVQEALTSPDPAAIDELERRHGYRAGAFLMYD